MQLSLFQSIWPTMKYQPGQANIVVDALSWSQHPVAEEPNQAQKATAREHILLLSSSSVEPQIEDLQKWRKAYQEDPKLRIVLQKLCQGQQCGGQFLSLVGLLVVK